MKQKIWILVVLLFASGCTAPASTMNETSKMGEPFSLEKNGSEIIGCTNIDRSTYGIVDAVFEKLPPLPACLQSITDVYETKKFSDEIFFTPEFFLQPEFYPSFENTGLMFWNDPSSSHWGVVGYGAYPSKKNITMKRGETATVYYYLHSGFGVRTYQGIRLNPLTESEPPGGQLKVKLDYNAANGLLLGPTFPKFQPSWAHRVDVKVRIPETSSTGKAIIAINSDNPEEFIEQSWDLGGRKYFRATQFIGSKTVMKLEIDIVE